jgi:hypothetical protein
MAKVFGESGRYVSQEATKKRHAIRTRGIILVCVLGIICGFLLGGSFPVMKAPSWASVAMALALGLLVWFVSKWTFRKMDELEKERVNNCRGAAGEISVATTLSDFPEAFCVINDLTTPYGNLDHVVVGPTGVFLLDTKNWRGVVSAACDGELLCNGKPTDKPCVRQFVGRIMGIKDRVRALATGLDPYFQALFVFTSARVDANWGTTKNVHCIRDDQLFDYIVESKRDKKLTKPEVEAIAQAFLGLAHMDKDFTAKAPPTARPRLPAIVTRLEANPRPSPVLLAPSLSRSQSR